FKIWRWYPAPRLHPLAHTFARCESFSVRPKPPGWHCALAADVLFANKWVSSSCVLVISLSVSVLSVHTSSRTELTSIAKMKSSLAFFVFCVFFAGECLNFVLDFGD